MVTQNIQKESLIIVDSECTLGPVDLWWIDHASYALLLPGHELLVNKWLVSCDAHLLWGCVQLEVVHLCVNKGLNLINSVENDPWGVGIAQLGEERVWLKPHRVVYLIHQRDAQKDFKIELLRWALSLLREYCYIVCPRLKLQSV